MISVCSTQLSTCSSVSVPLCSTRPSCFLFVPVSTFLHNSISLWTYSLPKDLFLIRPPEGAAHRPVKHSNIVIGGDSSGGGLAIALLQVIRDAGLPQPAGAVLVSPWCDLYHSFPSIFLNTDTVRLLISSSPQMQRACRMRDLVLCSCSGSGYRSRDWSHHVQAESDLAAATP